MEQMMDTQRKFPVGVQSFEKLRTENYVYIDKTELIYKMTHNSAAYFLGRPRRFGKSLLVSTLEAYYLGKKELFKGLAIEQLETEWKTYPVLHMDLNAERFECARDVEAIIIRHLEAWEALYGDEKKERSLAGRFIYIIEQARKKTGQPVVVLIDEYDKPLLQTIGNEALQSEFKSILKGLYSVLKSADQWLKFVFLTGVTKFGKVSIFSDLNHLDDMSTDGRYATLCGITQEELESQFPEEIKMLGQKYGETVTETIDQLRKRYDGYHFCANAPGVYNPFSTLNVLAKQEYANYWFQTGTPTFMLELLRRSNLDLSQLEGMEMDQEAFTSDRREEGAPIPLLYQSGYLTIKDYDRQFNSYTLGFPNEEVRYGFLKFVVPVCTPVSDNDSSFHINRFVKELNDGQVDDFLNRMKAFFAGIPYELDDNPNKERHYQVIFYLIFRLMGQYTEAEIRSSHGRADAVVRTPKYLYVFEFKLNGTAEEALAQINEKGYALPYAVDDREIMKIGVSFSKETRNLDRWIIER